MLVGRDAFVRLCSLVSAKYMYCTKYMYCRKYIYCTVHIINLYIYLHRCETRELLRAAGMHSVPGCVDVRQISDTHRPAARGYLRRAKIGASS